MLINVKFDFHDVNVDILAHSLGGDSSDRVGFSVGYGWCSDEGARSKSRCYIDTIMYNIRTLPKKKYFISAVKLLYSAHLPKKKKSAFTFLTLFSLLFWFYARFSEPQVSSRQLVFSSVLSSWDEFRRVPEVSEELLLRASVIIRGWGGIYL